MNPTPPLPMVETVYDGYGFHMVCHTCGVMSTYNTGFKHRDSCLAPGKWVDLDDWEPDALSEEPTAEAAGARASAAHDLLLSEVGGQVVSEQLPRLGVS